METDKTFTIRIRLTDWKKLRAIFPSYKGETAASYIFRLVAHLETWRALK